ncbi:NADP-dependent oxidoreductase domain-containing protein [Amanita rubescens]|nr:NADP-dependent oxidoreductase domain-containing protein [Amanita rubescens]
MSFGRTLRLSTGASIPQIGLGTWLSKPKEVEFAVEAAVRNGYRHLDLAKVYENQHEVGAALKKVIPSVVKREELFITSKLWNSAHKPQFVEAALDDTLKELGLSYLDLYLIHWPSAFAAGKDLFPKDATGAVVLDDDVSLVDTWKAMLALPKSKVRAVGVSNFTIKQLEGIIAATGVAPVVNQIEAHPLLPQDDLRLYCQSKNIHITAYSPLGNNLVGKPKVVDHPIVAEVAKKLGATPAQVLVAWGATRGYSVIPKSINEDRIKSNFKQIELSQNDYDKISSIVVGNYTRFNIPYGYKTSWDVNIFGEPIEKAAKHNVKIQ